MLIGNFNFSTESLISAFIYEPNHSVFDICLSILIQLCFAYKGFLQNYVRVGFSFKSSSTFETESVTIDIPHTYTTDSETV